MRTIMVQSIKELTDCPIGAIIGVEDKVFERIDKVSRAGEFVDFEDKDGKVCRLYVRAVGKIPAGQIERRRW